MAELPSAVVRCEPFCPKCGWKLLAPEAIEDEKVPIVAWLAVRCAGCDWSGHAKFWTRQADEPV
jgi:hypothetical protein